MNSEQLLTLYYKAGAINGKQFRGYCAFYHEEVEGKGVDAAESAMARVFSALAERESKEPFSTIARALRSKRYIGAPVPVYIRLLRTLIGGIIAGTAIFGLYFLIGFFFFEVLRPSRIRMPIGVFILPLTVIFLGMVVGWQIGVAESFRLARMKWAIRRDATGIGKNVPVDDAGLGNNRQRGHAILLAACLGAICMAVGGYLTRSVRWHSFVYWFGNEDGVLWLLLGAAIGGGLSLVLHMMFPPRT